MKVKISRTKPEIRILESSSEKDGALQELSLEVNQQELHKLITKVSSRVDNFMEIIHYLEH